MIHWRLRPAFFVVAALTSVAAVCGELGLFI